MRINNILSFSFGEEIVREIKDKTIKSNFKDGEYHFQTALTPERMEEIQKAGYDINNHRIMLIKYEKKDMRYTIKEVKI